jgi:hypothetical protein
MVQPDQAFAALVSLVLIANAAEREGRGDGLERLDANGDADYGVTAPNAARPLV